MAVAAGVPVELAPEGATVAAGEVGLVAAVPWAAAVPVAGGVVDGEGVDPLVGDAVAAVPVEVAPRVAAGEGAAPGEQAAARVSRVALKVPARAPMTARLRDEVVLLCIFDVGEAHSVEREWRNGGNMATLQD